VITAPPPSPPAPPAPPGVSKSAVAGGLGGAGVAIWLIDRLLIDGGEQAAATLTKLSPLLGPVWASWPVLVLLVAVAWLALDKWHVAQARQTDEAHALAGKVGEVAASLTGLRTEVHGLRGALQDHAAATDERLRSHEAGLGELRSEVSHVRGRVDVLERPRPPPKRRAGRASG